MEYVDAKKLIEKPSFILEDPAVIGQCIDIIKEHDGMDGVRQIGQSLADNYDGCINVLYDTANWMHDLGEDQTDIQNRIEDAIKEVILQNYNKTVTTDLSLTMGLEGYVEWCDQLVESTSWRNTFYQLAREPVNEDCPMLTFALTCIALKEDYVGELISVPSAWHTLETLLKCLRRVLQPLLIGPANDKQFSNGEDSNDELQSKDGRISYDEAMKHFLNMGCYSEHTYLIVQSVLYCLAQKSRGYISKRLSRLLEEEADKRGHDVSKYSVHFCCARDYQEAMTAMKSILYKKQLNQADITMLYQAYKDDVSPPVELLRLPVFVDLLANALFVSSGVQIRDDQHEAYTYLYAYAASVVEKMEGEKRNICERSRLDDTIVLVDQASKICRQWYNNVGSGISFRAFCDMPQLLENIAISRPVSYGVFHFIKEVFTTAKRSDFELNLETMQPYCIVVNELVSSNHRLHQHVLTLICSLLSGNIGGLEDLIQVDYKKMLVDMLIHLITCGMVDPVVLNMKSLFSDDKVDTSIVRYFVTQLLDIINPPYSQVFMANVLPLVNNANILAGLKKGAELEDSKSFIEYCSTHLDP